MAAIMNKAHCYIFGEQQVNHFMHFFLLTKTCVSPKTGRLDHHQPRCVSDSLIAK